MLPALKNGSRFAIVRAPQAKEESVTAQLKIALVLCHVAGPAFGGTLVLRLLFGRRLEEGAIHPHSG